MKKKNFKRIAAVALALTMTMQSSGFLTTVQAEDLVSRAGSQTQMSSDKEAVYVNTYNAVSREQDFDANWKFYLGDASGADNATFDDSTWENVNLPHDYSIEQEYTSAGEAESAYLLGGTGWYRKHFTLSEDAKDKEIRIDFGGVYMDSTVWVNGQKVGSHPYGYTSFSFDITDYVVFGSENVITVKVNHQTPSSRWYSGSGIYRSVKLTVMDKVHVDLNGTEISTPNLETEKDGTVNMTVKTDVANAGTAAADVVLVHTVYEKGTENSIGTVTIDAATVNAGETKEITATLPATQPKLWSVDDPNLYTVTTQVKVNDTVVDTYDTEFGFRYFDFNSTNGFSLNGEQMKLQGVCMHHDQGSLGAEAYYSSIKRQVKLLKEMGCNSIRVTHNPAAKELIQVCNELGMLVIEEAFDGWEYAKNGNTYDYARFFNQTIASDNQILGGTAGMTWSEFDLTAMITRDYNAPSIIMWSLGNEVWEGASNSSQAYVTQAGRLAKMAKELDSTRPSTIGDNKLKESNTHSFGMAKQLINYGGVIGANYCNGSQYDAVHNRYPDAAFYGAETASATNSRGVYDTTANNSLNTDKELTSYDYSAVGWGAKASDAWYTVITRDYLAGEYVWTGFDYLGEPTPANGTDSGWKSGTNSPKNSFFGIIDTAGLPKDTYYFYMSQWNQDVTTLHVLPAWNEDVVVNGQVPIVVYSNAAKVKLTFTDTDGNVTNLGTKEFTKVTTDAGYTYQIYQGSDKSSTEHQNLYLTWNKAYEDGTITAIAYDEDDNVISETVGRSSVTTTGDEAKLQASVDRTEISADGKDLSYITIDVTDADGNIVPDASNNVKFVVEGDGVLVGVDNGKQSDHQSFQDDNRDAYNGSLVAIVQSTKESGTITVTAQSKGLESTSVTITTNAVSDGTASEKQLDYFYMSKNYYVKAGSAVVLPETVEAHYTDGSTENLTVAWADTTETTGTFTVLGTVADKYQISVIVNMIDEVAALLNYSTATPVGQEPTLPASRPAVMADGEILDASFPVTWDTINASDYAQAGSFTVNGTADVLGKTINVTATVRVQTETLTVSGSIDKYLNLTQNIPEDKQSDTLEAIWDGSTEVSDNTNGGANTTAWTNWSYSQDGNTTSDITFEYATQQRAGEIVIHFFRDSGSARFPAAGTTKIMISDTGAEGSWTEVEATETIGEETNRVKAYTYSFEPFTATFIKFCLTNAETTSDMSRKACTGITEIEIKKAVGSFTTNTEAKLSALTVGNTALTETELAKDVYYTLSSNPTVKAVGGDNTAVTVLPAYNKMILIILESEDHNTRNTFTINLEQEAPLDPSDDSHDYPVDQITYSTGSAQGQSGKEGPISFAFDNDTTTYWHSEWSPSWSVSDHEEYLWVQFDFAEPITASAIRYLARGGNGDITGYRVEYKENADDTKWTALTSGTWARNGEEWYIAQFTPTKAASLRLVATDTYADSGMNKFASARELRVVQAEETNVPAENPFVDVKDGKYYTNAVLWAVENNITKGTSDTTFSPDQACTRAQVIMFLWNAAGNPEPQTTENPFTDVGSGSRFYKAILWAYENKITTGYTNGTFRPNDPVRRAEYITFQWRAAGKPTTTNTSNPFSDVTKEAYPHFYTAILWAAEKQITLGKDGKFLTNTNCSRADVVTFLYRGDNL